MNFLMIRVFLTRTINNNMKAVVVAVLVLTIPGACKKNQAGGNAEIKGRVLHHGRAIPHATVYIKYNAKEFPGEDVSRSDTHSNYDTEVVADAKADYSFKCYKGDYFLYAKGYDVLPDSTYAVDGGVPVTVRSKEVVEADVAVSEEH